MYSPSTTNTIVSGGVQIAYAAIPTVSSLPEPLRHEVRAVFACATRLIWQVMIGVSGAGMVSVLMMREEKLRQDLDEQWGLKEQKGKQSPPTPPSETESKPVPGDEEVTVTQIA